MIRRLQLLDAESRSSGRSASAVIGRIRDGLLRDNKVVPAVLGVLALLIFAWLVAGAVIDGPGDEEQQQASNQASLAQGNDSDSGDTETPAPGVENRDSDASYGGYDEGPKDPFRQIIPKADEGDDGGDQNGSQDDEDNQDGGDRDSGSGDNGGRDDNGGRAGNGRNGDSSGGGDNGGRGGGGGGDDEEDFIEQRSPNNPNSRNNPGGDAGQDGVGQGGVGQGGASQGGAGQGGLGQGGAGQAGDGLFNSGGDLPAP